MKRPGRNELCHCGSGKKYKKCCEHKDELAASALHTNSLDHQSVNNIHNAINIGDEEWDNDNEWTSDDEETSLKLISEANDDDDLTENDGEDDEVDGPYPILSATDEELVEQWWNVYQQIDDLDDIQSHLNDFLGKRPDLAENLGLEHEMLHELGAQYLGEGRGDEYVAFLMNFRSQFPAIYVRSAGHFDKDIIAWLISVKRHAEIGTYLNHFIAHPVRFHPQLVELLNLMLSTNVTEEIVPLLNQVAKALIDSTSIYGAHLNIQPLITNIFWRYIKTDASEDDVNQLLHEASTTLPVEMDTSPAAIADMLRLLHETARPFTAWSTKLPSTAANREQVVMEIGNNYVRYMHERVGISWLSARHYGMELSMFLLEYWKITSNKTNIFIFQPQRIANIAAFLSDDGLFGNTATRMTFLNALYYFAGYLEVCGNLNSTQAQSLRSACETVYCSAMKAESGEDMEIACYAYFPLFNKPA